MNEWIIRLSADMDTGKALVDSEKITSINNSNNNRYAFVFYSFQFWWRCKLNPSHRIKQGLVLFCSLSAVLNFNLIRFRGYFNVFHAVACEVKCFCKIAEGGYHWLIPFSSRFKKYLSGRKRDCWSKRLALDFSESVLLISYLVFKISSAYLPKV